MRLITGLCCVCLAILAAGCAHKPAFQTYRLVPQGQVELLVPPEVSAPELAQRTFLVPVVRGKGACSSGAGAIQLQARKQKLRVTVDRSALEEQKQPGWLNDWTMRLESQGCLAVGEGQKLGQRVVESVPLDSVTAFRLLHANDIQSGYVDLNPENQVEVRSPILKETPAGDAPIGEISSVTGKGATVTVDLKLSSAVVGFETDWYGIVPNSGSPGYHFVPISAERNVGGAVTRGTTPEANFLQFAPQAAYFRLFYKRDDNGVTAIIISGANRTELDALTRSVGADPSACARQGGMCLVLPKKVGVNPFLVVVINGKNVTVPLGATVRSAMASTGMRTPETVLGQLSVTRPYAGQPRPVEFNSKTQGILNLKLAGGETIAW